MADITVTGIDVLPVAGTPNVEADVLNDFQTQLYCTDLNQVFMNASEFAITIRYYHSSLNETVSYNVIFDDPHTTMSFDEVGFNTIRPQFQISECALQHRILKKDYCLIRGTKYFVDDFISDGVGVTTVYVRTK